MEGVRTLSLLVLVLGEVALGFGQEAAAESAALSDARQPRGIRKRLCRKHGICQGYGGGGFGGGGYGGGYGGGGGYQGYPPINIGISQSQSSSSAGGGGYANGYYPHNQQYNGYPNYGGYSQGYGGHSQGYGGYGGYPNQGGFGRPGYFGNGQGAYNNQFNGNYYGGQNGGYGFQGPFGFNDDYDEHHQDSEEGVLAVSEAGSYGLVGRKNSAKN